MSEPVTNADVEDVLSSIRRLVSEDKRPKPSAKSVSENDRLVLTPALRVASPLPEAQGDGEDAQVQSDTAPAQSRQGAQRYDDSSYVELAETARESADVRDEHDDPAEDYADDPYDFGDESAKNDDGDEGLTADDTPVPQDTRDDAAAMGHSDTSVKDQGDELDALDLNDPVNDDLARAENAAAAEKPAAPPKLEMLRPSGTLSDKIAALETAIGKISDRWEPDSPGADEYSGTEAPAMAWEDDIERDATGARMMARGEADAPDAAEEQPAGSAEAEAETETGTSGFSTDDQFLDEDALRDLVSEIVRAELQGALGERITRNVRKLVRREIHRAMTAQELE